MMLGEGGKALFEDALHFVAVIAETIEDCQVIVETPSVGRSHLTDPAECQTFGVVATHSIGEGLPVFVDSVDRQDFFMVDANKPLHPPTRQFQGFEKVGSLLHPVP